MVINVYLNCQLSPQLSTTHRVKPGHTLVTYGDRHALLTAATGNGHIYRP